MALVSTSESMLNVRYEEENLKANMSKTNTGDDLEQEHQKFWTQILQVYGSTKLFIKPARVCQQRRSEFKSDCSEKDVQPINPIK